MFGFSEVCGGPARFKMVREAERVRFLLTLSKSDFMVPSPHETSGKIREISKIPEISRKFPGNFLEFSWKFPGFFPGFFPEISRTFPGNLPEISRNVPGNFQDTSGIFWEFSMTFLGFVREFAGIF